MEHSQSKKVVRASFRINNNVERISSAKEFLALSSVSYNKIKTEVYSEKEQHRRRTLLNILEDMSFFYEQFLQFRNNFVEHSGSNYIQEKLASLLDLVEANSAQFDDLLAEQLKTDDMSMLRAVVYTLSSIELEKESSASLNRVLASFTECNPEQILCYINGLTHGTHPQLDSSLKLVQAIAPEKIKKACKTILQNRKQNHKSDNR